MDRTYANGTVMITRHDVDWDHLGGSTAIRLEDTLEAKGTGYFNPAYTVKPMPGTSKQQFFRQAKRAMVLWSKRLSQVLGNRRRRKACRDAPYVERHLEFIGILLLDGNVIPLKQWANEYSIHVGRESRPPGATS